MADKEYNSIEYNNNREIKMMIDNNMIGNNKQQESKYHDPIFQMLVSLADEESIDPPI